MVSDEDVKDVIRTINGDKSVAEILGDMYVEIYKLKKRVEYLEECQEEEDEDEDEDE